MFMYILYLTHLFYFFFLSWIDSSKQVFFNIKSKSSSTSSPSLQCMVTMYLLHAINNLDYSASNNNWFIPLFTPLHVIKHCPYWSLLILMFKHFFCFISAQDDVLWRGSGLRIRFKGSWEWGSMRVNIVHVQYNPHVPPSLPPTPFRRPDCSGSGSGLRIKFKVGWEWGSMRVNINPHAHPVLSHSSPLA